MFNHITDKADEITVVDMAHSSVITLLDSTIGLLLRLQPRRHCGGRGWATHGGICSGVDVVKNRSDTLEYCGEDLRCILHFSLRHKLKRISSDRI